MNITRALPVFSAAFALFYAAGVAANNTFLFFYPKVGVWHWGRLPRGPIYGITSMWYGWMLTAIVGAIIASAIYLALPALARVRVWPGWAWVIPIAMWLVAINAIVHLYWLPRHG